MDILHNFGIQPTLLLAQIVNFSIILFLLSKFFYKPISKMLDNRKKRIEESLANADLIEEKLKKTEEKQAQILAEAQKNAHQLLTDAKTQSEKILQDARLEARKSLEESLKAAQSQIGAERQKTIRLVQNESLSIIASVVKKVMGRTVRQNEKDQLTKEAIAQLVKNT